MKKFIPAMTLVSLLSFQASVDAAWNAKNKANDKEVVPNTPGLNVHDDRTFFLEADYLLWRPQLEDTHFALKGSQVGGGGNSTGPQSLTFALKQPSYDLSSGVRLGIGGYNGDSWDVGLRATYLYADAQKHVSANPDKKQQTIGQWVPSVFGEKGTKSVAFWRMNFYVFDFAIGREFFLTKRFAVHPFIGLRGFVIDQKLRNIFKGSFEVDVTSTTDIDVPATGRFKAEQDIWGVGPRLGLDLNFYLNTNWAFLGGLSGALLYSNHHTTQKTFGHLTETDSTGLRVLNEFNIKAKDKSIFGRANLDAYFGLGWDKWFNKGKNRVSIAALFEASHWFQMNQWFDTDVTVFNNNNNNNGNDDTTIMAEKRHGDLSFIGGTLHFQIDF